MHSKKCCHCEWPISNLATIKVLCLKDMNLLVIMTKGLNVLDLFKLLIMPVDMLLKCKFKPTQHTCNINNRQALWALNKHKCTWAGICKRNWLATLANGCTQKQVGNHYNYWGGTSITKNCFQQNDIEQKQIDHWLKFY